MQDGRRFELCLRRPRAAAAQERTAAAISVSHEVWAVLMNQGAIHEAALATIETLELDLAAGRDLQVRPLTATLADLFR
jgi:hypothetical protein